ncbi:hypothetical protein CPB84DRAFT_1779072 [Gymnopilus junonius]|uniref:Uncharacterized protein n=1 Tax=Gymnopilus junonius TaxID=109634 RepID=A0A9P5NKR5_GYMJU|nr:hypothetical protein CPB84DRAFT_1779072 [Gymnopilus junonius]
MSASFQISATARAVAFSRIAMTATFQGSPRTRAVPLSRVAMAASFKGATTARTIPFTRIPVSAAFKTTAATRAIAFARISVPASLELVEWLSGNKSTTSGQVGTRLHNWKSMSRQYSCKNEGEEALVELHCKEFYWEELKLGEMQFYTLENCGEIP